MRLRLVGVAFYSGSRLTLHRGDECEVGEQEGDRLLTLLPGWFEKVESAGETTASVDADTDGALSKEFVRPPRSKPVRGKAK